MRSLALVLALVFICFSAFAQTEKAEQVEKAQPTKEKAKTQIVEASCGLCMFGMKKGGCSLAVKIDDEVYPVDGSSLKDHGDPHAHDGMCHAIKKAEVSGEVVDGRFKATSFVVLKEDDVDPSEIIKE